MDCKKVSTLDSHAICQRTKRIKFLNLSSIYIYIYYIYIYIYLNIVDTHVWTTDVCVPISELNNNISETQDLIKKAGLIGPIIGHVGDGNYHVAFAVDYNNQSEWSKIQ